MDLFSQISLEIVHCRVLSEGMDFDTVEYLYKGKQIVFHDTFSIGIKSLNDAIFSTLYIIFIKKCKSILGFTKRVKVAGLAIRLRPIIEYKIQEQAFDVIPIVDLLSAEYFDKSPALFGRALVKFNIKLLNAPLEEEKSTNLSMKLINKLFTLDVSKSIEAINDIYSFLANGSTVCNLKSVVGMLILDGYLIKKFLSKYTDYSKTHEYVTAKCLPGYGDFPSEEAKKTLKYIDYSVAAYLDSKVWQLLIKPTISLPNIADSKLRTVLERIKIAEDDFIRYYEGNHSLVGFIIFVDSSELVISFRGTLSHTDIINDLDASYAPFFDGYAHSGMLRLAKTFIEMELKNINVLLCQRNLPRLRFIGHSLGGGIATLLHMMIRKKNLIPGCQVATTTFSAPPSVSESFLNEKFENLITYNYGNDVIPRLSLGSLLDFKFLCLSIANVFDLFGESGDILNKIEEICNYLRESDLYPKLYHPGTIYHLRDMTIGENKLYGIRKVNSKFFGDLMIHKDYIGDHLLRKHVFAFTSWIKDEK